MSREQPPNVHNQGSLAKRPLGLERERQRSKEQPPANPPMRIFVLCDGTGQDAVKNREPTQDTNVHRFRQCVPESPFVKHIYQEGVGTHTPENASTFSLSNISDLRYKAFGSDIDSIIHKMYNELCEKHENNRDAEIHLLGFSRGAFAVRCLACLIEDVGLLRKFFRTKNFEEIYKNWASQNKANMEKWKTERGEQAFFPVTITSCGVWDTVSALSPSSTLAFVNDRVPEKLGFAFQALALHERRHKYNPVLWKRIRNQETCIHQSWFAGDHSDIGGGWPDCGLANLTLIWMLAQYKRYFPDLVIKCDRLYERLCPPSAGWPSLSYTLCQGNVNHSWIGGSWKDGDKVRKLFLEHDAGNGGDESVQPYHRQTIHFTVRVFLAMGRREVTGRTCLLTAGYTETITPDQSSIAWVLKKTGKRKLEKKEGEGSEKDDMQKKGKSRKNEAKRVTKSKRISQKEDDRKKKEKEKNLQDTLTIAEDETTEWENDIIFEWTKKAQQLVDKKVGNLFKDGIALHGMTVDHLVRGHKDSSDAPSMTAEELVHAKKASDINNACEIIIDQAWKCSLESFLRENHGQGTCKAADKVHYPPAGSSDRTDDASDDPRVAVEPRKRSSSEKPRRRRDRSKERKELRSRSSDPSRDVESYGSQRVYHKPPGRLRKA